MQLWSAKQDKAITSVRSQVRRRHVQNKSSDIPPPPLKRHNERALITFEMFRVEMKAMGLYGQLSLLDAEPRSIAHLSCENASAKWSWDRTLARRVAKLTHLRKSMLLGSGWSLNAKVLFKSLWKKGLS
jgi:hypothetical protein